MTLAKSQLLVREITLADLPNILSYWRETSDEDLSRLGEENRPDEKENEDFLRWFCTTDHTLEEAGEDILIWEVNGKAIGYSTLKQFKIPDYAQIHIHMWEKDLRGKGYGSVFFCLSALKFLERYGIHDLYCAPKSDNAMPNRMLAKIGFPAVHSEDCIDRQYADGKNIKHTKYLIKKDILMTYLKRAAEKLSF